MDMFAWLVKVRCYLQTGKSMAAYVLVRQLISLLESGKRPMDLCECHMLLAVICHRSGAQGHMCEDLETALVLAKKHRYIRLLADEGICMVRMLSVYQRGKGADASHGRVYYDRETSSDCSLIPHVHGTEELTAWQQTDSLPSASGSYYLTGDVSLTSGRRWATL